MQKILLIDDDQDLGELLKTFFKSEGFSTTICLTGPEGVKEAISGTHDLAVLDVMLPGLNGFDVLRQIRAHSRIPIIMLTARGEEVDRIVGLELGADDYLAKPFNARELVARINAVFRRLPGGGERPPLAERNDEVLTVDDVELHVARRTCRVAQALVELTEVEFQIMELLLRSAGRVVQRQELAQHALGRHLEYEDRSLDVHISNLRKKLGKASGKTERIRTIRGVGYIFAGLQK